MYGDAMRLDGFAHFDHHPGYGPYAAVVQRVVDGDTFDAIVDQGFHGYTTPRFRLLARGRVGLDAWETKGRSRKRGLAAKAWVESQLPVGAQVVLRTYPDPDLFGRYLAEVTLIDGRDLGGELIALGHARLREWT